MDLYQTFVENSASMKGPQNELQTELKELLAKHLNDLAVLRALPESRLQQRPSPEQWSAMECLEHLCRYGDFYLMEVASCLQVAKPQKSEPFKSTWLGEYFAASMWPKPGFKTMNTFKVMNPSFSGIRTSVLSEFEAQLKQWQDLLQKSEAYSWRDIKTAISISKWIRLRLGDTLRVVIYHNQRHIEQAYRAAGLEYPQA